MAKLLITLIICQAPKYANTPPPQKNTFFSFKYPKTLGKNTPYYYEQTPLAIFFI